MYVAILRFVKLPELALKIQSSRDITNIVLNAENASCNCYFQYLNFKQDSGSFFMKP